MRDDLRIRAAGALLVLAFWAAPGFAQAPAAAELSPATNSNSLVRSAEDNWLDLSGFLDQSYGFVPLVIPITEPAVGYGAAAGLTFIDKKPDAKPNITAIGGLGTENGTWGAMIGDVHHWCDERLQTVAGLVYASANLDFYGTGEHASDQPLRYNLEPKGGLLQAKYRIGDSPFWAGLSYAFAATDVSFDAPGGIPDLPGAGESSNVGGLTPSVTFDSRDNMFTPNRGTYVEGTAGLFSEWLGSDSEFQRLRLIAMQYIPLHSRLTLGLRGDAAASFGSTPFYLWPFISLRGAPIMRYQGEEMAQAEAELRWQFWKRFSLVGFAGSGAAFDRSGKDQTIVTGGTGFRYELARRYGIHVGLDVAFGPDNTAIYVQNGERLDAPVTKQPTMRTPDHHRGYRCTKFQGCRCLHFYTPHEDTCLCQL